MRLLFYLGWVFLILAFAAASAEAVPRSMPGDYGFFVSAYELWYAAWPGNLVVTQIQVEKLSLVLWDPVLVGILALPAWFLFALPGVTLVWFCRPHREMSDAEREDLKKQEESLLLYEQLVREAEEAGFSSLWVMDHFVQIPSVGRDWEPMLDSYTTLGFLAASTERMRLGAMVSGVTYRNIAHLGKIVHHQITPVRFPVGSRNERHAA